MHLQNRTNSQILGPNLGLPNGREKVGGTSGKYRVDRYHVCVCVRAC